MSSGLDLVKDSNNKSILDIKQIPVHSCEGMSTEI